jgi:predicted PurR-regulated permease PerM
MPATPPGRASQRLLTAAGVVVVIAGLKLGATLLVPFAAAFFLALLSLPVHTWLVERRVPHWIAVTLAILVNVAFVAGIVALITVSVSSFVASAPRYRDQMMALLDQAVSWGESRGMPAARWVEEGLFDAASIIDLMGSTLKGVAALATELLLVLTIMVFILLEVEQFPRKLDAAFGAAEGPRLRWRYARISYDVQRYLLMKSLVSVLMGVLSGVGVWMLGLDFPILWGILAFLFNYVPNIGPILAAIPPLLLGLVTLGLGRTLLIAGLFVALHLGLGNILEPQLFGRRLGLSPLVVFASLIFWGWAWGPVGMLLSVPLTVIARIVFENSRDLRWVAHLLASEPPGDDEGEEAVVRPPPRAPRKRATKG